MSETEQTIYDRRARWMTRLVFVPLLALLLMVATGYVGLIVGDWRLGGYVPLEQWLRVGGIAGVGLGVLVFARTRPLIGWRTAIFAVAVMILGGWWGLDEARESRARMRGIHENNCRKLLPDAASEGIERCVQVTFDCDRELQLRENLPEGFLALEIDNRCVRDRLHLP